MIRNWQMCLHQYSGTAQVNSRLSALVRRFQDDELSTAKWDFSHILIFENSHLLLK